MDCPADILKACLFLCLAEGAQNGGMYGSESPLQKYPGFGEIFHSSNQPPPPISTKSYIYLMFSVPTDFQFGC